MTSQAMEADTTTPTSDDPRPLDLKLTQSVAKQINFTISDQLKRSEKHLILATTYGLNNSFSKKIVVGLLPQSNGVLEPVVQIINNASCGVTLDTDTWNKLLAGFETIEAYFGSAPLEMFCKPLVINDYKIKFTTTHGARAIIFDKIDTDQEEGEAEEECRDENWIKKPRVYTPAIAMQKPTFEGLENIVGCVDERLKRISRVKESATMCKTLIVEETAKYIISEGILMKKRPSEEFIKKVLTVRCDRVKEYIRTRLSPFFVDYFMDIVYVELTTLLGHHIAAEIKRVVAETLPKTQNVGAPVDAPAAAAPSTDPQ